MPLRPPSEAPALTADFPAQVRRARSRYQRGLLGWLRREAPQAALAEMQAAVGELAARTAGSAGGAAWWAAGASLEVLAAGEGGGAVAHRLLRELDAEMRRLAQGGPRLLEEPPPAALVRELVDFLAQADTDHPQARAVRNAMALAGAVPAPQPAGAAPADAGLARRVTALREALARWRGAAEEDAHALHAEVRQLGELVSSLRPAGVARGAAAGEAPPAGASGELAERLAHIEAGLARRVRASRELLRGAARRHGELSRQVAGPARQPFATLLPALREAAAGHGPGCTVEMEGGELPLEAEQLEQLRAPLRLLAGAAAAAGAAGFRVQLAGDRRGPQLEVRAAAVPPAALEAARAQLERHGGILERDAAGTLQLWLPAAAALRRVLLVRAAGESWALGLEEVAAVRRLAPEEVAAAESAAPPVLLHDGERWAWRRLAALLGLPAGSPAGATAQPVALLRAGGRRLALAVEGLEGWRELLVEPLPAPLRAAPLLAGAIVLGGERVVLLLDAPALARPR